MPDIFSCLDEFLLAINPSP